MSDCVFCDGKKLPQDMERFVVSRETIMVFEPLNPVTPGHLLVVPMKHVEDASTDPMLTSLVMHVAAQVAGRCDSANIITSIGTPATQSVMHLHLHVVPRTEGDGILLPWSIQQAEQRERARQAEAMRVQTHTIDADDLRLVEPSPIDIFRTWAVAMEDASLLPEHRHEDGRVCSDWIYPAATFGRNGWQWWMPYAKGGGKYGWTKCEREHPTLPSEA